MLSILFAFFIGCGEKEEDTSVELEEVAEEVASEEETGSEEGSEESEEGGE